MNMTKRVLCEMKTCHWTGIEYPERYDGNCYFTSDSKALQDFKKEALAAHPELKGKLRIMTVKSQQEKENAVYEKRKYSRGYQEWKAYTHAMW